MPYSFSSSLDSPCFQAIHMFLCFLLLYFEHLPHCLERLLKVFKILFLFILGTRYLITLIVHNKFCVSPPNDTKMQTVVVTVKQDGLPGELCMDNAAVMQIVQPFTDCLST
ncbi:hypothetical protein CPB85DRAFT_1308225, partial [Mucidula mucida]